VAWAGDAGGAAELHAASEWNVAATAEAVRGWKRMAHPRWSLQLHGVRRMTVADACMRLRARAFLRTQFLWRDAEHSARQ
jgi:hypothetical protein